MQISSETRMRIMIYTVLVLVVALGGGLFYLIWRDSQIVTAVAIPGEENNKYSGLVINNTVTSSPAFHDLQPITIVVTTTVSSTTVITPPEGEITDAEVRAAKRRHSNPFALFEI